MSTTDPTQPVLRVLTFTQPTDQPPHTGGYTCICNACQAERDQAVRRGVRRTTPLPIRKAA